MCTLQIHIETMMQTVLEMSNNPGISFKKLIISDHIKKVIIDTLGSENIYFIILGRFSRTEKRFSVE